MSVAGAKTAVGVRMSEGPEATYRRYLESGDWRLQKCAGCGRFVHFPRVLCPHCGADTLTWAHPTGFGRVYSVTVVHPPSGSEAPYNVSLVDLDEGVRLMSTIIGIGDRSPRIGERVRARFVDASHGEGKLLVFETVEQP